MPISQETCVDVKILEACYYKVPLVLCCVSLLDFKESIVYQANLVYVNNLDVSEIPYCYFGLTPELMELDQIPLGTIHKG